MKLCIVIWRNDLEGFGARCTSLPGCVVSAPTEQQARTKLEEAIRAYLASVGDFIPEGTRVLERIELGPGEDRLPEAQPLAFERAGAREQLYFEPSQSKAAIVTAGGLCPGLNNVIRSTYFHLRANYGVPQVLGIRYGYQGLNPAAGESPVLLTDEMVEEIHEIGGTILGSSRGEHPPQVMVDFLEREAVNLLFCVGGDGTQRGAHAIAVEAARRKLPLAVVGIPKTIDNDIPHVWRSFGFATALEKAREHITGAHNEARGAPNGVGVVKLMGRNAGFIAAGATLTSGNVNFTLIPEVPLRLDGDDGFLAKLRRRVKARGHAVVVVAEGAGQDLLAGETKQYDASGNAKPADIGTFLRERIALDFRRHEMPVNVKYFDPSYHIRSMAANADDSLLGDQFARYAVDAALAGKTDMLVGLMHNLFIHVPLPLVTSCKKTVSPESDLWIGVTSCTGQDRW